MKSRATFGVIVGTRGFFPARLAVEGRRELLAKLDTLGYAYVVTPQDATPNGAIETYADAQRCAALFRERKQDIDGILVVLPNFGDEVAVVETLRRADLDVPVMVQACDDEIDKLDIANRRDAFCGKLSVCNNLYQYGIPFTTTRLHTCAIGSDSFSQDLDHFARVCRTVRGLRSARIGAIGARPDPFRTMRCSEKLLQASGPTVITVDLSEVVSAAGLLDDAATSVREKIAAIRAYGRLADNVSDTMIVTQAKLSVVIEEWVAENQIDAGAIQCWSSLQENYGCASCLTMSMLGEANIPFACEVDVAGAVSMYALLLASGEPPALLDWNNNYGEDRDKCINIHCSNYPKTFLGCEPEIGTLDILGAALGEERCFGAVKGMVSPGPMTFARITTDDTRGEIRTYVGEGHFTDDTVVSPGGVAVCHVAGLQRLLRHLCQHGFEHHVAMTRSHCADVLAEAFSRYLGWDVHRHGAD